MARSVGSEQRRDGLARLLVLLALLGAASGCGTGELALSSGGSGGAATGAPSSSGGASATEDPAAEPAASSGGTSTAGGGSGTEESLELSLPCALTGRCPGPCAGGGPGCPSCLAASDCGGPLPLCDEALGACVECLISGDCVARFGSRFPVCSAGRCVECQTAADCGEGELCSLGTCSPGSAGLDVSP